MKYDEKFNLAVECVFESEGEYVNDKYDHGGPTNYGITQRVYDDWNKRHNIPKKDVRKITKNEAKEIYYYDYWVPSGANKIDDIGMAYAVFDTEVNAGHGTNNAIRKASGNNLDNYLKAKAIHHANHIKKYPNQKRYKEGWEKRLRDVRKNAAKLRFLQKFPTKYSGNNAIEKMTNKEFRQNEININKEIQTRYEMLYDYNLEKEKLKKYNPQIPVITGGASSVHNIINMHNKSYKTKYKNPASKRNNFAGVEMNGKKWQDWTDKERNDFIEGFDTGQFTNEGIKHAKLQEKMWTKNFNIGNPDTDKGHWITLPNGKHIFIKD